MKLKAGLALLLLALASACLAAGPDSSAVRATLGDNRNYNATVERWLGTRVVLLLRDGSSLTGKLIGIDSQGMELETRKGKVRINLRKIEAVQTAEDWKLTLVKFATPVLYVGAAALVVIGLVASLGN